MAAEYQQLRDNTDPSKISETILRVTDQAYIPNDPANRDRQEYMRWLDEGNTPDPPPPIDLPEPGSAEPMRLPAATPTDPLDATPKAYVDQRLSDHIEPLEKRIAALEKKLK